MRAPVSFLSALPLRRHQWLWHLHPFSLHIFLRESPRPPLVFSPEKQQKKPTAPQFFGQGWPGFLRKKMCGETVRRGTPGNYLRGNAVATKNNR